MAKKPADDVNSDLLNELNAQLTAVDKAVQDAVKKIGDFQKELKKIQDKKELEELQRLIKKRQQMFDLLSSMIEKYNSTANDVIRNIAR